MNTKSLTVVCGAIFLSTVLMQREALAVAANRDPNRLLNPSFNDLLLDWKVDDSATVAWVPNFGVPGPDGKLNGAVAIGGIGNSNTEIHQCVGVGEGEILQFSFSGLTFCDGGAGASVVFSDDMCNGEFGIVDIAVPLTGQWTRSSTTVQVPAGSHSAIISLTHRGAIDCDEVVFFDEIFLGDQIFANKFE